MLNKLAKLREERAEGDNGFTLIELLVVVVIIGVLVAIAIPLYLNYRTGAQNRSAQSDVRNSVSAIEACIGDSNGKAPTAATGLASASGGAFYLTCGTSTGQPAIVATATTGTTYQQTINVSPGVVLTYTSAGTTYTVLGKYGTNSASYTYDSSTGKTT